VRLAIFRVIVAFALLALLARASWGIGERYGWEVGVLVFLAVGYIHDIRHRLEKKP
jgi:hypothetical protein